MKRKPLPKPRSLAARALESPLFRMQKVKTLKGKGSYKRRPKYRGGVSVFVRILGPLWILRSSKSRINAATRREGDYGCV
jgi:hypothetical protein